MDDLLLQLLLKIEDAQKSGRDYFYRHEESNDPHAEVAGLKELERQNYITCGKFLRDMSRGGGYFAIGGPCRLEYAGQRLLRDFHARPHVDKLRKVGSELEAAFAHTLEHLEQAARQLMNLDDERARKDAVRDCLSAMESLLKTLTGTSDIKDATTALKKRNVGQEFMMKEGLAIWDHVHRLYPDVRHGQEAPSTMSKAAALYWVERALAFIRYVSSAAAGAQPGAPADGPEKALARG